MCGRPQNIYLYGWWFTYQLSLKFHNLNWSNLIEWISFWICNVESGKYSNASAPNISLTDILNLLNIIKFVKSLIIPGFRYMRDYYKGREMHEIDFNVHHFWKAKWMSCDESMPIDSQMHMPIFFRAKGVIELQNATCAHYIKNNSPLKLVKRASFSSRDLDQTIFWPFRGIVNSVGMPC